MGVCRKMNEIFKGKVVAITWKDSGGGVKALASAWLSLLGSEERTWAPLSWSFYPSSGYAGSEHQHWGLSRSTTILLTRKESDAGKDRRHEEKGAAECEGLESSTDLVDMNLSKLREWSTEEPGLLQPVGLQRADHDRDWTTTILQPQAQPRRQG